MSSDLYLDSSGNYRLNESGFYRNPFWLTSRDNAGVVTMTAPVAAGAQSGEQIYEVDSECVFVGRKLLYQSTRGSLVRLLDNSNSYFIAQDPVHLAAIAGTSAFPFLLTEPIILESEFGSGAGVLTANFKDIAGGVADNVIYFYIEGERIYRTSANSANLDEEIERIRARKKVCRPMFLAPEEYPVVLGAGGVANTVIRIPKEYHFTFLKITACQADGTASPAFTLEMQNTRRDQMMSHPVLSTITLSPGLTPEIITPWMVKNNSEIRIELNDISGGAHNVYLTFYGRAIYTGGTKTYF